MREKLAKLLIAEADKNIVTDLQATIDRLKGFSDETIISMIKSYGWLENFIPDDLKIVNRSAIIREVGPEGSPLSRSRPGRIFKYIERGWVECAGCGGKGWLLAEDDRIGKVTLLKCDSCDRYEDDEDAVSAAIEWIETAKKLMEDE